MGKTFNNFSFAFRSFQSRNKKITVREITYSWKRRNGDNMFTYFSVTDGANLYEPRAWDAAPPRRAQSFES